ncbi:heme peroxidase [Gracilaria domingensis]|nr:heme peroxidase [Gracilaria domingensis]
MPNVYMRFPQGIPLLFANYISRYELVGKNEAEITRGRSHKARIRLVRHNPRRDYIELEILDHDAATFPVPMKGAKFTVQTHTRQRRRFLVMTFEGKSIRTSTKLNRARNIYATALVRTMLENAQVVLRPGRCSRTVATITGVCNNPHRLTAGITNSLQQRPWKAPGMSISDGLPNPRLISNTLCKARSNKVAQTNFAPNKVNFLLVIFGQFIDHDIVLTPSGETSLKNGSFEMPPSDAGNGRMHFLRSDPIPLLPRECCNQKYKPSGGEKRQFNRITSLIDGSGIYGSDNDRALALRAFKDGKLQMDVSDGQENLPRNSKAFLPYIIENANQHKNTKLFAAGDIRANENAVLTSMHTLFAREHNRVCDELIEALRQERKVRQTDEWLYQQARRIVIAEIQNILYNEYLPLVLGRRALKPYKGYNPFEDTSIDIMFSTAAFRWGHTTIRDIIHTRDVENNRRSHRLQDLFFNPDKFSEFDVESWLLGAMDQPALAVDLEHTDSVRDFLFNPGKRGILDLPALNIQRGRDHTLPSYTAAREAYGLKNNGQGLGDIPDSLRTRLLRLYSSSSRIDPFIGGLAEKPLPGSLLGPFFHKVVAAQFERLRDGDRFYYENLRWGSFMRKLPIVRKIERHQVRLRDVILANTNIRNKHIPNLSSTMRTA